jgi:exodeoxyribonuclease-3
MLSPEALDKMTDAGVDKGPRGLEKPSDHTPIWCDLKI